MPLKYAAFIRTALLALSLGMLAGCAQLDIPFFSSADAPVEPRPPVGNKAAPNPPALPPVAAAKPAPAPQPAPVPTAPARIIKIGLLVPLSGNTANLGKSLQDAAFLALNDKYNSLPAHVRQQTQIVLVPKDSGQDETSAMNAMQELNQAGVSLVLGPVFGPQMRAIQPMLAERNIMAISFSNNKDMAGKNILLMSFLPEQQISRVMSYAKSKGIQSIAGLLPNDNYGETVGGLIYNEGTRLGMTLSGLAYYPKTATSVSKELQQLIPPVSTTPKASFQALVLPEGGERLNAIARDMQRMGIDMKSFKILGSGQWDDAAFRIQPSLIGSWFATADPEKHRRFEQHFQRAYNYQPARLGSLSYDAIALASTLVVSQPSAKPDEVFNLKALTQPAGFNGPADGIFRFLPDGTCERGLTIMEVTESGAKMIDRAPEYFSQR
jgi:ABC-type branched-subunit amino acid transport system substrate-binding protein